MYQSINLKYNSGERKREKEIFDQVDLCDTSPNSELNENSIGFSRFPKHNCNIQGHYFRKKKWNYWCIMNEDYLFAFAISSVDYIGVVFVYFYERKTKLFYEKTTITPFGYGCNLHPSSIGDLSFNSKSFSIQMLHGFEFKPGFSFSFFFLFH